MKTHSESQTPRDKAVYDYIWETETLRPPSETFKDLVSRLTQFREPKDNLIADLGCGIGRHTLYAASKGLRVISVDHSSKAIERLQAMGQPGPGQLTADISLVFGDFVSWVQARESKSLHAVVCFDCIHHAVQSQRDLTCVVGDLVRVIKPGGYLLLTILTDISYGSGERPEGRLFVTSQEAMKLLDGIPGVRTVTEKTKKVEVLNTRSLSLETGELVETDYLATRVLKLFVKE